jgi:hypothetical protein
MGQLGDSEERGDGELGIGTDAYPAPEPTRPSPAHSTLVDDLSRSGDEGEDAVEATEPLPASLHASRRRRRLALLVAGVLAVTTAAVATVVAQHHSSRPSPNVPASYEVYYEATGSTHSATIRYALPDGSLQEEGEGVDLVERSPQQTMAMLAPGTDAIIEVQNTSRGGAVGCSIYYSADFDLNEASKGPSAQNASLATCAVKLP